MENFGHSFRPGHKKAGPESVQLLLCADFNSLPESGVIEFIKNGRVPINHPDLKDIGYAERLMKMLSHSNNEREFIHAFQMASAYTPELMPYTNYTYDFKGIIDYIFYPKTTMKPLGILGPISEEWLKDGKIIGCPHPHIPSDHFSLLGEMGLTLEANTNAVTSSSVSSLVHQPPPSLLGLNRHGSGPPQKSEF